MTIKGANFKMKHYLNTNKIAKSFVLAGALTLGVFAGGQFTEAAGPDKVKPEQAAHVNRGNSVKSEVKAKPAVPAAPAVKAQVPAEAKAAVQPKEEKAHPSQAAVHASETAKLHAAPNSAVLGKGEPTPETLTEEKNTEEVPVQEPAEVETVETVTEPAAETQNEEDVDAEKETESEKATETKAEGEEAAETEAPVEIGGSETDSENADTAVDEPVTNNDEAAGNETEEAVNTDAVVNTTDDEEDDKDKDSKVNPSAANKANSQASEHASDKAKEHAAANSAVHAGKVIPEDGTEDTVVEPAEDLTNDAVVEPAEDGTVEVTEVNPSAANKVKSQASEHASKMQKNTQLQILPY